MKPSYLARRFLACLAVVAALAGVSVRAQSFQIDWFTIDGGGGTSSGGVYQLSGTIGQPDAGQMTGGIYALIGGFWSIAASSPSAFPRLSIARIGADVRVFWRLPATDYVLEQTPGLGPTPAWTQVSFPYQTNSTDIFIDVSAPAETRFYRLRK